MSRLQKNKTKQKQCTALSNEQVSSFFFLSGFTLDFIELLHKNILITMKTHLNSDTTKLTLEGNVFDYIFRGLVLKDGLI